MPVDRAVVRSKFTERFKKYSLSQQYRDNMIKLVADAAEDEESADNLLESWEPAIIATVAEADRVRALSKKPDPNPNPNPNPNPLDESVELPEATDPAMKQLLQMVKGLQETVVALKNEKSQESLEQRFKNDERIKDIPDFIRNGYVPKTEEEFEAKITTLTEGYGEFSKTLKPVEQENQTGDAPFRKPVGGAPSKKSMEDAIGDWAANKGIPAEQTT